MKWYTLEDGRLCFDHPLGFRVIKPAGANIVPLMCPVCASPMLAVNDPSVYRKYECCEACSVRWVDLNKEEWAEGWRPSESQVAQELNRRRARPKTIIL